MELLWFFGVMAGLAVVPVVLGLMFGRERRLRRKLRQHPILSIAAARDDRVVRIRGVVRGEGAILKLPFTGKDGVFHFEGVPAGSWTLKAWHEEGSETSIPLSVPLSPSAPLTLTIDTTAYRPVPHKNKYGKEYPPQSGSDDERY